MNGVAITAANQEISSAMVVTAKMPKVYSPVVDLAVAIGKKPAAVMMVPDSIGNAVEEYA